MEEPPLELLGSFLMHNIPSIIIVVGLVFAWNKPMVGFVVTAVLFKIFIVRRLDSLPALLLVVLPILMVAQLFLAEWWWHYATACDME